LIKSDRKDIFLLTQCFSFELSIPQKKKNLENNGFHKNIKQHSCIQHW